MAEENSISERLREQFLKEAGERLKDIETGLLRLEGQEEPADQLRLIFRGFHGLKGIAGYVSAREMIDIANAGESLLAQVRDDGVSFDPEWVEVLLRCHDDLRNLLEAFGEGSSRSHDWKERLGRLQLIVAENRERAVSGRNASDSGLVFVETAQAHLAGLDLYLEKLKPGIPEKGLANAISRKLRIFLREAAEASREDLVEKASVAQQALDEHKEQEWSQEYVEEFAAIISELRSSLEHKAAPNHAHSGALPSPPSRPVHSLEPRLEIKAEYVEMLEALVSDFSAYAQRVSDDLGRMRPLIKPRAYPWLKGMEADLEQFASALTRSCHQLHLAPLSSLFEQLPRLVRDAAKREGKMVQLEISDRDAELERHKVERLTEPLVHLIRNAVYHGLEPPEERIASGKPEQGTIRVEASTSDHAVTICVADDGRGIDFGRVRDRAVKLGLLTREKSDKLSAEDLLDLIFVTGLTTTDLANTISGRGVGMEIVRESVAELGGTVEVHSAPGKETLFMLTIPLNLNR